jgi:hypothetical protein
VHFIAEVLWGIRKRTQTAFVRNWIEDCVSATRGKMKMKRIKRITKVRVLEAQVRQGLVLTFLEKQLMNAWSESMQKAGGKGPEQSA